MDEGALDQTNMADWIKNLDERKTRGDIRTATVAIESIDVTDYTAAAKITLQFEKAKFTDYLSLLRIDEKWIIIGKIYSISQTVK